MGCLTEEGDLSKDLKEVREPAMGISGNIPDGGEPQEQKALKQAWLWHV